MAKLHVISNQEDNRSNKELEIDGERQISTEWL